MQGRLADLLEPITESHAIYDRARERIRKSSVGYDELCSLPERLDPDLRQQSDDFETVYGQAAEAQKLLKSKVASCWQQDPNHSKFEVPAANALPDHLLT